MPFELRPNSFLLFRNDRESFGNAARVAPEDEPRFPDA